MMNYIATGDGQFINLAAVVMVEDVTDEGPLAEQTALLTTITGEELEVKGQDAERLFDRIELIALETDAAQTRLRNVLNEQGIQP